MRLWAASRPVSSLPLSSRHFARLPGRDFGARDGVEIDATSARAHGIVGELRPVVERRRLEGDGARAVEHEVRMASGCAVGNQRDGEIGGVGGVVLDLHVEDGGEAAESLGADAEGVDLLVELDAQFFGAIRWPARDEFLNVDGLHQGFFGQQHGLLGGAANADAENSGGTPACAHRGDSLEHPVDDGVGRIQHDEFRLGLGASAFGGDDDFDRVAGNDRHVDDGGRVVIGVRAFAGGIGEYAGAQLVVLMQVGAANTLR